MRHRFSPLFISPFPVPAARRRNASSENRVAHRPSGRFAVAFGQRIAGFFDRSIRPEPPSAPARIRIELQLSVSCSFGKERGDLRLMKRCRKRGRSPCFERFVSERRQTDGWNGRRECDTVRNMWLHPEVFGKPRTRLAESVANRRVPSRNCRLLSDSVSQIETGKKNC